MRVKNRFLFNFAASYSEGGYKRLCAYATWFNSNGGAWFAIHPRCSELIARCPNNRFFVIERSHLRRLYDDWGYLDSIRTTIGRPDVYYAYGIPLYVRFGHINWFHLSNVLPLGTRGIPLSALDRLKFSVLGGRIKRGFALADMVSAESKNSLKLLNAQGCSKLFLSVNGSDDELAYIQERNIVRKDNIATILGTYRYKALNESWRVFQKLKSDNNELKLIIIGDVRAVPSHLRRRADVVVRGVLERSEVIDCLRRTKFYISTSYAENSSNAVSEGIFLADESYISDLGPHRELLSGSTFDQVSVAGVDRTLLHIKRNELSTAGLMTWNSVVSEMRTAALRLLTTRPAAGEYAGDDWIRRRQKREPQPPGSITQ
jgi:glycosyltransferase involved in cell wall biosynthesis